MEGMMEPMHRDPNRPINPLDRLQQIAARCAVTRVTTDGSEDDVAYVAVSDTSAQLPREGV